MKWFKRISLLILTNILVMVTLSIVFNFLISFFGLHEWSSNMNVLLLFSLVWGMGGAFISLLLSKFMAKTMMGVQILDPDTVQGDARDVVQMVYRLSQKAGLTKMPEVGIYESPDINAFATGPSRSNSLVAVSTGLLNRMSKDEVEGVLGHEIAHVANGDMVTMTLIQGVVNAFVIFFARIVAQVLSSFVEEKSRHFVYMILVFLFDILFTILGSLLVNYFSRLREFRADAGGAQFAGRQKMIAGLQKLLNQFDQIEPDSGALAALKISNKPSGLIALFSTHPPLEERIRRLQSLNIK